MDDGAAAVDVEFGDVFAGKTLGCGKPQQQSAVDNGARFIAKSPKRGPARRGQCAPGQFLGRRTCRRSGHTKDGYAGAPMAARKGVDRFALYRDLGVSFGPPPVVRALSQRKR